MRTYVGRVYSRTSHASRWTVATVVCIAVISVAIVGVPTIAEAFRYLGL
jgi:hypothetical protein